MASSSFELDDQTDEDFFDNLVIDDIDFVGSSTPSVVAEGHEAVEAKVIAGLRDLGVEEPERVDSVSGDLNSRVSEDLGEKGSLESMESLDCLDVAEETKVGGELESDSGHVKLVQWASFGSDSPTNQRGSFSDLFGGIGDGSDDPFANVGKGDASEVQSSFDNLALGKSSVEDLVSPSYEKPHDEQQTHGSFQDLNGSQYWENAYPGWKFDPSTEQWYQLEGFDANVSSNGDANFNANLHESSDLITSNAFDQKSDSFYSEQTTEKSVVAGSVSESNRVSQGSTEYPANMVFDPLYPGWYYDTVSQGWKSLDSYNPAVDYIKGVSSSQEYVNESVSSYGSQNTVDRQDGVANWDGSFSGYNQQQTSVWQNQQTAQSVTIGYAGSQQLGNQYMAKDLGNKYASQQIGLSQGFDGGYGVNEQFQSVNNSGNFAQYQNQTEVRSNDGYCSPTLSNSQMFIQQPMQSQISTAFSYVGSEERTSTKRPPHALVTFGFGGKLVVMKDASSVYTNSAYGTQDSQGGVINVHNLMDVVMEKNDTLGSEIGGRDYFNALCHQSFPGPLVGGNAGSKELNKWIDEKIANNETSYKDVVKGDHLRLLFSLLKIAVQYYGKLRYPFGSDQTLRENDSPELAVANLFASAKKNLHYANFMQCLQNIPSEAQIQATALEVQQLLVSGRKKEALDFAQEGQLWGPALIIAAQLGDQLYGDTVKKMALKQFIAGSPLRTLCLLIAGQPADVFSDAASQSSAPTSLNMFEQTAQVQASSTLDEWTQNLAIITANRTKDDELVIIHLGDSLWKETGEITAAHICYLVAEVDFEQHSDSARLCLVGADHWKSPRTYASPEAIQRTELYEYAKVLGNSQFLLLPFQPYKLVYAHMLAEVGKISESLKYCQAILKSLKTGRAPELETWRQLVLSLEERIKTHQQGGYGTNLAPIKLVGKLFTFLDSTAHRVVGGLPPPIPSTVQGSGQHSEHAQQLGVPRVSITQSTVTQSTLASRFLMPSASMEPISASANDDIPMPNRSISEPDFNRSPRKADSSKKENSSNTQEKASAPSGSRFGRFGSQIFQKTLGLVIKSRQDKQAKLGEANSFYYDEKLKRWVERGVEPPPEQEALPPPPPTMAFQSGIQDYSSQGSPQLDRFNTVAAPGITSSNPSENSLGIPPIPPGSNQFAAHGRMGVRSRYVDTFNKGGGTTATNLFRTPPTQAAKPIGGGSNPKFFVPAPVTSFEETAGESLQEATITSNNSSTSLKDDSPSLINQIPTLASIPSAMPRFPSMDTIVSTSGVMTNGKNTVVPLPSRRTASWSVGLSDARSPMTKELRPVGEAVAISPPIFVPSNPPQHLERNSGSFGEDLHDVQL